MARQKSSRHKHHKQKHRKKKHRSSSPAGSDGESSGSENSESDGGGSNGLDGRKNEEKLKAENRDAILKRSRMWQTVSSDDDSDKGDDDKVDNGMDERRQRSRGGDHDRRGKHHRSYREEGYGHKRSRGEEDSRDGRKDERGNSGRHRRGSSGRGKGASDRDSDSRSGSDMDKGMGDSNSSSDSSSEGSDGDDDGSDSESEDEHERSRKRAHGEKRSRGRGKKHEEQKTKRRDDEVDGNGSGRDRKHHKKSRHSSSSRGKDRKEKKRHRERSKDKKAKKKKEKKKEKSTSGGGSKKGATPKMMGAVDQNAFGKYGVLREADYFSKQREFEVWMMEQKKILDTGGMPKWETKQYFREYMEDFNTATLPHEKYIDLEKWEMAEFHRKKAREMEKRASGDAQTIKQDEMDMKMKRLEAKEAFNKKYDNIIKSSIRGNKRESMQSQELLKAQMQVAYKQGDMETVKRIEKRLKPDEMEGWR